MTHDPTQRSGERIALLLSGGVDSSVALHRLQEAGHDVTAFYLKIWLEDELAHLGECPWEEDLRYARAVAERAGVDLEVVSLQRLYRERVVEELIRELRAGRTPSPDIWCNRRIKFGAFVDALEEGYPGVFAGIASGHYARLGYTEDGRVHLRTARDPVKDQTYFLCELRQDQLARCRFPLGDLEKSEVRRLARVAELPTADRRDSQGICFLGKLDYDDFVAAYLGERPGPIVEAESGQPLGQHRGYWFHTLGQRRGLGLSGGPWYVVGKDPERNELRVSRRPDSPLGPGARFRVPDPHWTLGEPGRGRLELKVRHGPQKVAASVAPDGGAAVTVTLDAADPGIAPGQYAVFYDGEECLGGGAIASI